MIPIRKIMKKEIPKLSSSNAVEFAVKIMEKMNVDYLLIEGEGEIKGIVTSHELIGYPSSRLILDCKIQPIGTISEDVMLDDAFKVLEEKKANFLVILNQEGLHVGVVNREIIFYFLFQQLRELNKENEEYIAELKKAEEALRKSKENFYNIVGRSDDGIVVTDKEGITRFVNQSAEILFGRNAEELIGEVFGATIVMGKSTEIDILHKGGKMGVGEMRTVETEWEGKPGNLIMIRDITERKKAEEELERSKIELEKAYKELKVLDTAKSDFIAIASHELKTPLSIIHGYCSLLEDGTLGKLDGVQKEKLGNAVETTEKLIKMVSNILDLSAIEAGKLGVSREKLMIGDIVKNVANEMKPIADKRKQKIIIEVPEKLPVVVGDKNRLYTVFYNLIDNAIKYTPNNGMITIKALNDGKNLHFMISDTGEGIPSKDLEKIFDRFYSAESHLTRKGEGIGLGLAICKGIIEVHNGKIWAESKLGKGSTFHFTLPKKEV